MKPVNEKDNNIQLIWKDSEALSYAAAHYFVKLCNENISKRGIFTVALSGGSTPKRLYEILSSAPFSRNINWKKTFLFWGDERFVPHTHEQSNFKMTKEALLDHIKIPDKNIFPILTQGQPQLCAQQYEATIKNALGRSHSFDLTLLGMGDDGHTASLFPGTDILQEQKKLVKEVWLKDKQIWRISFTYPLINQSKEIMYLIAGGNKAPVIKKIFSKRALKASYPIQNVNPAKGTAVWMLDEAAAGGTIR